MLAVHKLDNHSRIKGIIQGSHFESWQAVKDFVVGYGIAIDEVADAMHKADPYAGPDALTALIWGTALALKIKVVDPCIAAVWLARGLGDLILPGSPACEARLADGYGRLASMLLQRGLYTMAVVGGRIPKGFVEVFSKLAKLAARLRRQNWDVLVLCRKDELQKVLCGSEEYLHAEVEFTRDPGWLRVSRSSAARRPDASPPVVYSVSSVAEGVAVLDFERANLCMALSEPDAVMFAHPIIGAYVRHTRGGGRLVRAASLEIQKIDSDCEDMSSRVSAYMVGMYADFEVHGIILDSKKMENAGFIGISGQGVVETIMVLANRVAAACAEP